MLKKKIMKKITISSLSDEVEIELPKVKRAIEKELLKTNTSDLKKKFATKLDTLGKEPAPAKSESLSQYIQKENLYFFGFGDGIRTLVADGEGVLEITDIGADMYSLKDWNLIVTDINVIPLDKKIGKDVTLPIDISRGILIGPDGCRVDFCNIAKITLLKDQQEPPKNIDDDHLILADIRNNAQGCFVTFQSSKVLNLAEIKEEIIPVNLDACGILTGPGGNVLTFSKIKKIIVPKGIR